MIDNQGGLKFSTGIGRRAARLHERLPWAPLTFVPPVIDYQISESNQIMFISDH